MSEGPLYPPFPNIPVGHPEPHFERRRRYTCRRPGTTRLHRPGDGNYHTLRAYQVPAEVSDRLLRAKGYSDQWMLMPIEPIPVRCHLWMPFWGGTVDNVLHEMSVVRDEIKGAFLHPRSRRHVTASPSRSEHIRYVYINGFIRRIPDEIARDEVLMGVLLRLMVEARRIGNLIHNVPQPDV